MVCGGDSSEAEVSLRSAANVFEWVDKNLYNPYMLLMSRGDWSVLQNGKPVAAVDKNDFSAVVDGIRLKFDAALIVIHGAPGENGVLQSYLDIVGVPYTTCGAFASALTFNKFACKSFLQDSGVAMAKAVLVRRGDAVNPDKLVQKLGLPIFAKPNNGGSSFGVTKVKSAADLQRALDQAFKEDGEIILEEFIGGTEVTCGAMILQGKERVLPVTEVVSKNDFFDYNAKYTGQADEITPARISQGLTERVQRQTLEIYKRLGCSGITRVDYIIRDEVPYFLEINTVPGMTAASFIPQQLRAAGLDITQVLTEVLEDAMTKRVF